jgi:RimJ/RimL family protein N-acetyltransferase
LRPWTDADAPTVYEGFQDPAIRHWHVRTAESIEQVRQWILQWRSAWSTGNGQWAVTSNGEVAGRIGSRQSDLTIELTHSVHNVASCRVAAKCGFPFEGTLRGAGRHSDGRHDMHLHARLRTD